MKDLILILCVVCFFSCKKEPVKEEPASPPPSGFQPGAGIFITNEGNFSFGNSKISYYNFSNASVAADVFQPANSRPLGDVCQSMRVINGKGYIVVNNSGKIEIVNMNTFSSIGTITGFTSPRYILNVNSSKAYVTDLFSNSIKIVDLNTGMISGSIPCSGWTEQLVKYGDKVFVTNQDKGKLFVINSLTDVIIDSIPVSKGANSLVLDKNNKLWVLCSGESASSLNGALYKIDPSSNVIEKSFSFPSTESPWRLTSNGSADTLYYLNKGICRMWTGSSALSATAIVPDDGRNFYALGIDPATSNIYVADAIDYVQSGKIYVYNANGSAKTSFLAGIIPGDFIFY
jgi:hypothetical protein